MAETIPNPTIISASNLYTLSHYQRSIWLGVQSHPDGREYNTAYPLRIRSQVDVMALRKALQYVVNRHAVLRTTYPIYNGEPVQQVHPHQEVTFKQIHGVSWSQEEVRIWAESMTQEPYDLARGPLFQVYLLTCALDDHLLLFLAHHIVLDMMSWWILLDELDLLLPSLKTHSTNALPISLPIIEKDYQAFVTWHNATLERKEGQLLQYWDKQLAGELPVLNLPTDRPRQPIKGFRGSTERFRLPHALSNQLRQLASEHSVTLYTLLLASYKVLLARLSGQEDIVVGTVMAARSERAFHRTVGLFANLVPLRTDLSGNPPFTVFLRQVSQTMLGALVHQTYPFYKLTQHLTHKPDPSHTPIFQTIFQFEGADHDSKQRGRGFTELLSGVEQ